MNDVKITEPWDDARIREAFIDDGGLSEYHDPINGARTQRLVMGDIFDRWLAARDAALAAEQPATPTPSEVIDWIERAANPIHPSKLNQGTFKAVVIDKAREHFASPVATPSIEQTAQTIYENLTIAARLVPWNSPSLAETARDQFRAAASAVLVSPVSEQPIESHAAEAERLLYGERRTPMFEQPAPLDPEPYACLDKPGNRYSYQQDCDRFDPQPGYETNRARYEQGGE